MAGPTIDAAPAARLARALASPTGVLVLVPLLVVAAGVTVLLLGRRATRDATESTARAELVGLIDKARKLRGASAAVAR